MRFGKAPVRAAAMIAALALLAPSPGAGAAGRIIERGVFDCFTPMLPAANGRLANCEISAAAFVPGSEGPGRLIFANDKPIPGRGRSPVFVIPFSGGRIFPEKIRYLIHSDLRRARKYESLTLTPDGRTVIAATAFDRNKDAWNNLLAWPARRKKKKTFDAAIVSPSRRNGVSSSRGIRAKIRAALKSAAWPEGPPYFKVEGLAAVPGGKLLFGIREEGDSRKKFGFAMKIVSVSYDAADGALRLRDDFRLAYRCAPPPLAPGGNPVALSSIEYDPYGRRLYLLTSYEAGKTDEGLGAFLWTLPLKDFRSGRPPALVRKADGGPLRFAHKAEGLAVIDKNRVFVVHDDDRVTGRREVKNPETQFRRLPHQAAYSIVALDESVSPAGKSPALKLNCGRP